MNNYISKQFILAVAFFAGLTLMQIVGPKRANLARAAEEAAPSAPVRITLAAAGDVMMHMPIVESAYDKETKSYDFAPLFAPVAPYLRGADYALANLETRLAAPGRKFSGYPRFNSPAELAEQLRAAGIGLLATANNHSLDMGWEGVVSTLQALDNCGLAHVGTYRSPEEKATPLMVNVRGVRLGILNYAGATNGLPIPAGKEFAVNLLTPEAIQAEANAARAMGADLVIALLHFGNEYSRKPEAGQRELAKQFIANGVDVIIGSHAHVVQPIEKITVMRGGKPYQGVVAYSLGNFISNQRERYRDSGIILYLQIEKNGRETSVTRISYLPVWVQKSGPINAARFRIVPVHGQIPAASDLPLTDKDRGRMQQVWEELTEQLNDKEAGIGPVEVEKGLQAGQ